PCGDSRKIARRELSFQYRNDPIETTQLYVNGRLLLKEPFELPCPAACWSDDGVLVAAHLPPDSANRLTIDEFLHADALRHVLRDTPRVPFKPDCGLLIRYPWDLIAQNAGQLARQILMGPRLASFRKARIDEAGIHTLNPDAIRCDATARIKPGTVLDAENGPIFIGPHAIISPNVVIRGPCCIHESCLVQAGASIREGTTIGPVCKVGGEIEGSIFQGYANKQHDGFVGHSYIGEWVN